MLENSVARRRRGRGRMRPRHGRTIGGTGKCLAMGFVRADSHIATTRSLGPMRARVSVVGLVSTHQDTGTSCNSRAGRTPPNLVGVHNPDELVRFWVDRCIRGALSFFGRRARPLCGFLRRDRFLGGERAGSVFDLASIVPMTLQGIAMNDDAYVIPSAPGDGGAFSR